MVAYLCCLNFLFAGLQFYNLLFFFFSIIYVGKIHPKKWFQSDQHTVLARLMQIHHIWLRLQVIQCHSALCNIQPALHQIKIFSLITTSTLGHPLLQLNMWPRKWWFRRRSLVAWLENKATIFQESGMNLEQQLRFVVPIKEMIELCSW